MILKFPQLETAGKGCQVEGGDTGKEGEMEDSVDVRTRRAGRWSVTSGGSDPSGQDRAMTSRH